MPTMIISVFLIIGALGYVDSFTRSSWTYSGRQQFLKSHIPTTWIGMKSYRPITYVPLKRLDSIILVRKDRKEIVKEITSWGDGKWDEDKMNTWRAEGFVFHSNDVTTEGDEGTQALLNAERRTTSNRLKQQATPNVMIPRVFGCNLYVNAGSESELALVKALKSGPIGTQSLERPEGTVFTNISTLFVNENVLNRADDIASRLKNDHSMLSDTWVRWTNKTSLYNATSLTQVFAEYFRDHSIGDIGGPNANYSPRPGYPGTLSPGEHFKESNPFSELPNRILHPWPAMQEIPFHVRCPPSHPMIPPPLLWFALNDMYTDNFTATQLEKPSDEIVGGYFMEPKDAIRIARNASFGMSYDPKDQLEHGGMIFYTGHNIKNYNPDHGPTVSTKDAEPPVPASLNQFVHRWIDTDHQDNDIYASVKGKKGIDGTVLELSSLEQQELDEEDLVRQIAAEKVLQLMPATEWQVQSLAEEDKRLSTISDRVDALQRNRREPIESIFDDFYSETEKGEALDEQVVQAQLEADQLQANKENRNANRIANSLMGNARGSRELISYTVEILRDMQNEIGESERDLVTKRKSGRRRQRKKSTSVDKMMSFDTDRSPFESTSMGGGGGGGGGDVDF